jgi:hypothetical protein
MTGDEHAGADAQPTPEPAPRRVVARAAFVVVLALAWTSLFWFLPPQRMVPSLGAASNAMSAAIVAVTGLAKPWPWVVKSWLLAGVVVVVAARLRGGRRTGLGLPSGVGLRLTLVALLVALPVQVALGMDPAMPAYYRAFFGDRGASWIAANAAVMVVEHMFIEGAVLALALPGGLPDVDERARRGLFGLRALGRVGLGRLVDVGAPGPRTWLGVPAVAWPAIVGQGLVFGCIHFTKAPSELVSAFPGGVAVGWLTVRTGSVWPAAALHLGTGAVVLATMTLTR